MNLIICSNLYISQGKKDAMNLKVKDENSILNIYLNNAILLGKTLRKLNVDFVLFTNNKNIINEMIIEKGSLYVKENKYHFQFPEDINFYSAHYKLEAYKFLSHFEPNAIVGLFDLDMIVLRDFRIKVEEIIKKGETIIYDISDQVVPAYGINTILKELKKLDENIELPLWFGGEFIISTPHFFSMLYEEIKPLIKIYKECYKEIVNQGDEIITSVAIYRLMKKGYKFADAGRMGLIGRYWSVPAKHSQNPVKYYFGLPIIHLPADKEMLANYSDVKDFDPIKFEKYYRKYLVKRLPLYFLKWIKLKIYNNFLARISICKIN